MKTLKKDKRVGWGEIALFAAGDLAAIMVSMLLAHLITGKLIVFELPLLYWALFNIVCVYLSFGLLKVYLIITRSAGIFDALRLSLACLIVCVLEPIFAWLSGFVDIFVALVFAFILFDLVLLLRFSVRIRQAIHYHLHRAERGRVRVMIVGAGAAGTELVRELQTSDKISYHPVCLVDDDVSKRGKTIGDVKVVGSTEEIPALAQKYNIGEILIAMPSAPKKTVMRIFEICKQTHSPVKIVPGVYQFVSGETIVSGIRDVEISDLLGREQVHANLDEISGYLKGKTILVTGGGGSIGSELCRQIAVSRPKRLIILDIYENNAYDIEQELKRHHPELDLVVLIASVRDRGRLESVFRDYRPDIVFNAAAHKHVPLMETSPNEAVKNNVFGTLNCAELADRYKVETFVQISTDKAVNPTNVMGATKRICEMIVQTIGRHSEKTNFVAVRFGNVLGSNGSVIPLFKRQIAEGGPVTVTDANIIRYFMTIPEAVLLVLQAGAYAKGGQIFVLDMGEPVKIYDLARNLIELSGFRPDIDIEIKCTGLRPGEKLFEERLMDEEGMQTTAHGLINIARPIPIDEELLHKKLDELYAAAYAETDDIRKIISELVTTYQYEKEDASGH